jgi:hypothetical protein
MGLGLLTYHGMGPAKVSDVRPRCRPGTAEPLLSRPPVVSWNVDHAVPLQFVICGQWLEVGVRETSDFEEQKKGRDSEKGG